MNRKIISLSLSALLALSAGAQGVIDLPLAMTLRQLRAHGRAEIPRALCVQPTVVNDSPITVLVKANDDAQEAIEALGTISGHRGGVYIVTLPASRIEQLAAVGGVTKVSASRRAKMKLDMARPTAYVDDAHEGTDLAQGFDGTGVVVGMVDGGVDPNHIAFKDDEGNLRVKAVYYATNSSTRAYETPEAIAAYTTDDSSETHGTHVCGIMAGGYKGNHYYGVAPGADIVMVGCDFYDNSILNGAQKIIDYAQSVDAPAVVNMSLGMNTGPHDGTDAFSQYLASLGEDCKLCIAAGNEGDLKIALYRDFAEEPDPIKTIIYPQSGSYPYISGSLEFWGSDDSIFRVKVDLINSSGIVIGNILDFTENTQGETTRVDSALANNLGSYYYTGGYIEGASYVDPDNNRYTVNLQFDLDLKSNNSYYAPKAYIAVTLSSENAQKVWAYCDGYYDEIVARDLAGYSNGVYDGSINGMACGQNVFAIGAYTSRTTVPSVGSFTGTVGDITYFSSWGNLCDGRTLPHVCAPGHAIVSTYSQPYSSRYSVSRVATATSNGKTYVWSNMSGTSMSTPFASGVIALWLQARPDLTFDEVLDVIDHSSTKDDFVNSASDPAMWGAGKINAWEGLKYLAQQTGIQSATIDTARQLAVKVNGRQIEALIPGEDTLNATLYSTSGSIATSAKGQSGSISLDAQALPPGIYILSIQGSHGHYSTKIAFSI
ncbi:MAG: S8 family peptidase [Bacteroidales bacterium]|nr:S8 family peptidase [Bacteroidales bacterium]